MGIDKGQEFLIQDDWKLLTDEELDAILNPPKTEEQIIKGKIQEAQAYLNSTDWYYARKAETGEDVPVEVVEKRLASRKFIQDNKEAK